MRYFQVQAGVAVAFLSCSGKPIDFSSQSASTVGGSTASGGSVGTAGTSVTQGGGGAAATGGASSQGGGGAAPTGGISGQGGSAGSGVTTVSSGGARGGMPGAGGAGGVYSTGGTMSGTGGTRDCSTLVTNLNCVTDSDCCVEASARCETPLWLVTASEAGALSTCLTQSGGNCSKCYGTKVEVVCQGGQCVGTDMGLDMSSPPSRLSSPHCGKLPIGTGGASAAAATTSVTGVAAMRITFGCG